jgi:hypothetical protein
MGTIINLRYCGMAGKGPTVKAAKADAAAKIEHLLNDMGQPVITRFGAYAALIWRGVSGWHYGLLSESGAAPLGWSGEEETKREALDRAKGHLASLAMGPHATDEDYAAAVEYVGEKGNAEELADALAWQRAYAAAMHGNTGGVRVADSEAAREWAWAHKNEFKPKALATAGT